MSFEFEYKPLPAAIPAGPSYAYDSDDSDDLNLTYPESDEERAPQPQPARETTSASSQTLYSPAAAPEPKLPDLPASPAPAPAPAQQRARASSTASVESLDIPLASQLPPRKPRPSASSSAPPKKKARRSSPTRSPLEMLALASGAHTLHHDPTTNSASGAGAHYSVSANAVSILKSDGAESRRPPSDMGYAEIGLDDHSSVTWRETIGEYIGALEFGRANSAAPLAGEPPWMLAEFPAGYVLTRRTQYKPDKPKPRMDIYLYGGPMRFCSPAEFAPHGLWLMRGAAPGECACKYCGRTAQLKLTSIMDNAVQTARAAPASASASAAPLSVGDMVLAALAGSAAPVAPAPAPLAASLSESSLSSLSSLSSIAPTPGPSAGAGWTAGAIPELPALTSLSSGAPTPGPAVASGSAASAVPWLPTGVSASPGAGPSMAGVKRKREEEDAAVAVAKFTTAWLEYQDQCSKGLA